MTAFYNEIDPKAAAWLRELIAQGHLAPGIVDERSITEISPHELTQFTQCHFSPGSVAGLMPCDSPAGQMTAPSGPAPAPASLSAQQARELARLIRATSGQHGSGSSASADLTRSLASRLLARMPSAGSMEYVLTWKPRVTPEGRSIFALRARARSAKDGFVVGIASPERPCSSAAPTSGSGFTGWPTPMAGSPGTKDYNPAGNTDSSRRTVALVGWSTPSSRDWKDTPGMSATGTNPDGSTRHRQDQLPRQAALACLQQAPASGQALTSSPAGMVGRGALNPAHSRWLMGYPAAWHSCGVTVMRSIRGSRRSSSKRMLTP